MSLCIFKGSDMKNKISIKKENNSFNILNDIETDLYDSLTIDFIIKEKRNLEKIMSYESDNVYWMNIIKNKMEKSIINRK